MQKVKSVIEYDGSYFEGFQRQKRTNNTVTGKIEEALLSLGIESKITGSGRTDAKVHATGQVIDFNIPAHWQNRPLKTLQAHINGRLEGIRFKHTIKVSQDFHSRFLAKERIYRYLFKANPSVFERKYISQIDIKDINRLNEALKLFTGVHNFSMFMKSGSDVKSTIREIKKAYAIKRGDYGFIYFHANGFLRAQVRMMIFASCEYTFGKISKDELMEQIDAKKRYTSGLASPEGLYLARVIY